MTSVMLHGAGGHAYLKLHVIQHLHCFFPLPSFTVDINQGIVGNYVGLGTFSLHLLKDIKCQITSITLQKEVE